jgi:hypothetical protein
MSGVNRKDNDLFTIVQPMNAHDAVTVRSTSTPATYHIVDYADEATRRIASSLSAGESARLDLSRVGERGNVWRAEAATPRATATGGVSAGD